MRDAIEAERDAQLLVICPTGDLDQAPAPGIERRRPAACCPSPCGPRRLRRWRSRGHSAPFGLVRQLGEPGGDPLGGVDVELGGGGDERHSSSAARGPDSGMMWRNRSVVIIGFRLLSLRCPLSGARSIVLFRLRRILRLSFFCRSMSEGLSVGPAGTSTSPERRVGGSMSTSGSGASGGRAVGCGSTCRQSQQADHSGDHLPADHRRQALYPSWIVPCG